MKKIKVAYIGGGSMFVPSIINGIADEIVKRDYQVELALYDTAKEKADKMAAYGEVVRQELGIPLEVTSENSRQEAIYGSDIVVLSVSLPSEISKAYGITKETGFEQHVEGIGAIAEAIAISPFHEKLAQEIHTINPGAWLVSLVNPTDILPAMMHEKFGITSFGLCVEVDGLKGALAYYFDANEDEIELMHAGVNHDGWVTGLKIGGTDMLEQLRLRWWDFTKNMNFHPGNTIIPKIGDLTGYIKSSAYHQWPYSIDKLIYMPGQKEKMANKRVMQENALNEAIKTGRMIHDISGIHPEESCLNYPASGRTIGKLISSRTLGISNVISMQVINNGAVQDFPYESVVEVPAVVNDNTIRPLSVEKLPEWLCGYTALIALQRLLVRKYLISKDIVTLKRALSVLPFLGKVENLMDFAQRIHKLGNELK